MHPPAVTPETHLPSNMDVLHLHGCCPSRKEGDRQHMSKSVKNEQKSSKGILLILDINLDEPYSSNISKWVFLLLNVKLGLWILDSEDSLVFSLSTRYLQANVEKLIAPHHPALLSLLVDLWFPESFKQEWMADSLYLDTVLPSTGFWPHWVSSVEALHICLSLPSFNQVFHQNWGLTLELWWSSSPELAIIRHRKAQFPVFCAHSSPQWRPERRREASVQHQFHSLTSRLQHILCENKAVLTQSGICKWHPFL